jgi:glucosylglycerate synthase
MVALETRVARQRDQQIGGLMADDTLLSDELLSQLISVGEVDLLVAIPSYNNAETIGHAVEIVEEGVQAHFPRERVVIVNADGGSKDGTSEIFSNHQPQRQNSRGITSLRTERRIRTNYASVPNPGLAFRTILAAAELLRAKACAVVSPLATNATPDWICSLLQPVYNRQMDFVAPLYTREKFEGLLTRNVLYPITRGVLGRGIRELQAGEMGFSGKLASYCLNEDVWHEDAVLASPEIWVAVTAITSEFQCVQSYLGPRTPLRGGTSADIVGIIRQTLGTLFWCLESRESSWVERGAPSPVPAIGADHALGPQTTRINRKRLLDLFRSGVQELAPILESILSPETLSEIQRIAALEDDKVRFENSLWARTLCDCAASYHRAVLNRDHLIQAFVPLYRGSIYSFMLKHQNSSQDEIEADVENLCLEIESLKPYLIEKWQVRSEVKS